jgi:hypothetical protein
VSGTRPRPSWESAPAPPVPPDSGDLSGCTPLSRASSTLRLNRASAPGTPGVPRAGMPTAWRRLTDGMGWRSRRGWRCPEHRSAAPTLNAAPTVQSLRPDCVGAAQPMVPPGCHRWRARLTGAGPLPRRAARHCTCTATAARGIDGSGAGPAVPCQRGWRCAAAPAAGPGLWPSSCRRPKAVRVGVRRQQREAWPGLLPGGRGAGFSPSRQCRGWGIVWWGRDGAGLCGRGAG